MSTYQRNLDWLVMRIRILAHLEHGFLVRVVHDNRAESRGLRVEHLKRWSTRNERIIIHTTEDRSLSLPRCCVGVIVVVDKRHTRRHRRHKAAQRKEGRKEGRKIKEQRAHQKRGGWGRGAYRNQRGKPQISQKPCLFRPSAFINIHELHIYVLHCHHQHHTPTPGNDTITK